MGAVLLLFFFGLAVARLCSAVWDAHGVCVGRYLVWSSWPPRCWCCHVLGRAEGSLMGMGVRGVGILAVGLTHSAKLESSRRLRASLGLWQE